MSDTNSPSGAVAAPLMSLSSLGAGPPAGALPAAVVMPYNPEPQQERTRGYITYALLGTLLLVILFLVAVGALLARDCYVQSSCASAQASLGIITGIMNIVFTPIIGLVGSVIGFYFGAKTTEAAS